MINKYLGGGIGNAQFSTELVDWDKSCEVRILTRDSGVVEQMRPRPSEQMLRPSIGDASLIRLR